MTRALSVAITPWSMGWMAAVVLGGSLTTRTWGVASSGTLCDGALSTSNRMRLSSAAMRASRSCSHSLKTAAVIQPLPTPL
ncbi:hypothetical protein PF001_g33224 [Phytophthora fragariae]|nr:hypothetical protein PF001_g33224 [Phytophthora fragariae]